jgi:hypothetical protein
MIYSSLSNFAHPYVKKKTLSLICIGSPPLKSLEQKSKCAKNIQTLMFAAELFSA